jgi:hypothetical protein
MTEPNLVWHYTRFEAMQKILESEVFWASHSRFLNDLQEGYTAAAVIIRSVLTSNRGTEGGGPLASTQTASLVEGRILRDFFAVSFSGAEDDLSQWRGYSQGGVPVALGFDFADLKDLFSESGFSFRKCDYPEDGESSAPELVSLLSSYLSLWNTAERVHQATGSAAEIMKTSAEVQLQMESMRADLLQLAPRIKNKHFSHEMEWRAFRFLDDVRKTSQPIGLFEKSGLVVPFITAPFANLERSALRRIRIGPHPQKEGVVAALRLAIRALDKRGALQPENIDCSQIPFRG